MGCHHEKKGEITQQGHTIYSNDGGTIKLSYTRIEPIVEISTPICSGCYIVVAIQWALVRTYWIDQLLD